MIRFENRHNVWLVNIFAPVMALAVSACSTMKPVGNDYMPKPIAVISKNDVEKMTLSRWRAQSSDVFASSSFSATERFHIVSGETTYFFIAAPDKKDPCPSLKVVSIRPVVPAPIDGSKREIWVLDACSVPREIEVMLTATELDWIKANPRANVPVL